MSRKVLSINKWKEEKEAERIAKRKQFIKDQLETLGYKVRMKPAETMIFGILVIGTIISIVDYFVKR